MFTKKETHLVVLNDFDDARTALSEALREADRETEPGLRRALEIVDGIGAGTDPRERWARQVLAEAGVDAREKEILAIKTLREALPGLGLVAAVDLVRKLQAKA
ncbi:hypothetical protein [Streptomyces sp. NPDC005209]|uniref:hypothetical protein n=1 Tax=Streptomyces sp. NPDC005209 TaxID=3156715 RepID=UPI0033BE89E1